MIEVHEVGVDADGVESSQIVLVNPAHITRIVRALDRKFRSPTAQNWEATIYMADDTQIWVTEPLAVLQTILALHASRGEAR